MIKAILPTADGRWLSASTTPNLNYSRFCFGKRYLSACRTGSTPNVFELNKQKLKISEPLWILWVGFDSVFHPNRVQNRVLVTMEVKLMAGLQSHRFRGPSGADDKVTVEAHNYFQQIMTGAEN